ncbi:MAG: tetraacyldisaccharide 4'-kinase [Alphaproteobacteria bacterium]|nr:tetraacyldisaccharide 4'-kinase [Alphaproteobacteria bacterium]
MRLQQPSFWNKKGLISLLLLPFGGIYLAIGAIKRALATPYRAKVPVICIGNITVGGTGKTPIVRAIAEFYHDRGKRVAILYRGFGGKVKINREVSATDTAATVGDEAIDTKTALPWAKVIVGANRAASAKLVENKVDVIIMDDGLQNYTLAKDFRICVIDAKAKFGNALPLPAGPMRELPGALKNMDAVIFTNGKGKGFTSRLVSTTKLPPRAAAMAAIGNPNKFFDFIEEQGTQITNFFAFPDHHKYTDAELKAVAAHTPVITTSKDYVKIPKALRKHFTVLNVKAEIDKAFFKLLP